jgi:hypothetical protein
MSNRPDLKLIATGLQAQQLSCDERLEDYLEHLGAPLVGIVPYPERKAFRQEAHAHIEGLIHEYVWQGQDLDKATETALREFGEPWNVGRDFLEEWLLGTPRLRPPILIRRATSTAFAWFGIASMLILLLLEQVLGSPAHDAQLSGLALAAFLAPFVAGGLTGTMCSAQAERGVRNAVGILTLHSVVIGLLLLPRVEGLAFAAWQLLFWLPAGRITATVTATALRQARRKRFWQIAR